MTTLELKEWIFNNNKVEFVLDKLGCGNIKYNQNKEYYSASQVTGDNPMGVVIYNNPYLGYHSYTRENKDNQDIFDLVQYSLNISFIEAVKYLHRILGLEYRWQKKQKIEKKPVDPLDIFTRYRNKRRINVSEIHVLDEELLQDYVPLLYIDWFKSDGIMPWTAKKFGIAYSYKRKRIMIPIRWWLDGSLLGFNARTTVQNYEEFGISKYHLTKTYRKSDNVYGLWENYKSIKEAGYAVLYESEKSVLKRHSRNDPTGVAVQGHTVSDEQARILIGLNVDIVIAFDKDVNLNEIRHSCEKFYGIRNVYYIKDENGLLGDKDSPADAKNKIYQFLFKYKTKYDTAEHEKYLKSLKR